MVVCPVLGYSVLVFMIDLSFFCRIAGIVFVYGVVLG